MPAGLRAHDDEETLVTATGVPDETATPDEQQPDDVLTSEETVVPGDEQSEESRAVEELARQHPSTEDGAEGVRQADTEGGENSEGDGPGAGEDYAGSGF